MAQTVNYPVGRSGNNVRNVAVGDFNGDGKLDMAVPNTTDRTVSILLGRGDGTFFSGGSFSVNTGATNAAPHVVVVGDFNEDGKLDLVVSDYANAGVVMLLGNGDGTFRSPKLIDLGTGTGPNGMAAADINRDGHLDLVVADSSSTNIAVLKGKGDGTFLTAVNYATGTTPYAVAVGDFNGDGAPDVAVALDKVPGAINILLNNGSGVLLAATSIPAGGDSCRSLVIGDFNHDGKLDIATANSTDFDVSILLGNGNGTFKTAVTYPAGSNPRGIATADFDGDGVLDLVVTDGNDNLVYILSGNSDGTFNAAVPFETGMTPDLVNVADFNGDGRPDIVAANTASDNGTFGIWNVSVLLNSTKMAPSGTMAAKLDYAVGLNPNSIGAGDFNGDGVLDLVTANLYSNSISYLRGVGDGTFAAAVNTTAGTAPSWVTTGDFNRDGKLDVAVTNLTQAGKVTILLGKGDGTFQAPTNMTVGAYPACIATGDFNGDGKIDLAVANSGSDDISIMLGNGDGTFQSPLIYGVGAAPYSITVGDFNRDGIPDLAVANYYSSTVSILLGNGDGTFQKPSDFCTGYNPICVTTADVNRDGILDLVAADYWSGDVSVLLGRGDGNFCSAVPYKAGLNPDSIAMVDFNRDGILDILVSCEGSDLVYALLGKGDGTFLAPTTFATHKCPAAMVSGDFDSDGRTDLATVNWDTHDVSVLLNWKNMVTTPSVPVGVNLNGGLLNKGVDGMSYGFSTGSSINSLGFPVEYQFDWKGDGTDLSEWGVSTKSNAWDLNGSYLVRARARCVNYPEVVSAWSATQPIDINGPTISSLVIEGGVPVTTKTTVAITYTVSGTATQIRTSTGGVWSAWQNLPVSPNNVVLGTTNGLRYVYAQVKDADGRMSDVASSTIVLDTTPPTGMVQINGGNTTVLSGGGTTTVRLQLAMFDADITNAKVRIKVDSTFSGDPDPNAPWGMFSSTGQDVVLTSAGVHRIFVQFMDGVSLKSPVYSSCITVSATGAHWPGVSAITLSNLLINSGTPYVTNSRVSLTYQVSQSTNIKVRYLTGTTWTAWETPSVDSGQVTKWLTLSGSGVKFIYVQLMETALSSYPGAVTDPKDAMAILVTTPPQALVQIDQGVSSIKRFNTETNALILTILATDTVCPIDKVAVFQTGNLPSSTIPPAADAPDWVNFTPTMRGFGLRTLTTGAKSVYVWVKDAAGKVSLLRTVPISVTP